MSWNHYDTISTYCLFFKKIQRLPGSLVGAITSPLTRAFPFWGLRDIFALGSRGVITSPNNANSSYNPHNDSDHKGLPTEDTRDESVYDFMYAQFGPFVTNVLLDAAFSGIYAGDLRQMSARTLLPSLWELREAGKWWGNSRGSVAVGKLRSVVKKFRSSSIETHQQDSGPVTNTSLSPFTSLETLSSFVKRCMNSSSVSFVDGMSALPRGVIRNILHESNGYEGTIPDYLVKRTFEVGIEPNQTLVPTTRIFHNAPVTHLLTKEMFEDSIVYTRDDMENQTITVLPLDSPCDNRITSTTRNDLTKQDIPDYPYFVCIGNSEQYLLPCDVVIAATPASALASILKSTLSSLPSSTSSLSSLQKAISLLQSIPFASIGVASVAWSRALLDRLQHSQIQFPKLDGFGYLVPKVERGTSLPVGSDLSNTVFSPPQLPPNILGMTWDSSAFPEQCIAPPANQKSDHTDVRISVMMGGATNNNVEHASITELREIAIRTCTAHLKVPKEYLRSGCDTTCAPLNGATDEGPEQKESLKAVFNCNVAANAIPQYTVGHQARVRGIEHSIKEVYGENAYLLGNSYYGIGVADCVKNAIALGAKVVNKVPISGC